MNGSRAAAALLWAALAVAAAGSQDAAPTSAAAAPAAKTVPAEPYAAAEFPRWALDLRRAEAVAFGSLPFTVFFSAFAVDSWRFAAHDWDRRYAPWPLKTAGAVPLSEDEALRTFALGCAGAAAVAVADYLLVAVKRRAERKSVAGKPRAAFTVERTPLPAPSADVGGEP